MAMPPSGAAIRTHLPGAGTGDLPSVWRCTDLAGSYLDVLFFYCLHDFICR